ncbi:hypothetical protein TcasGA2_TC014577 [Tribolium castaneum]|uniref:Uncharacterized protein n=1 Tax=Tribolium castaneum TaxID=7070 RepID=D6WMK7_TRICA|nr:hypothetical protein TcasGA2_TC014577 [Tribolium castaneum]
MGNKTSDCGLNLTGEKTDPSYSSSRVTKGPEWLTSVIPDKPEITFQKRGIIGKIFTEHIEEPENYFASLSRISPGAGGVDSSLFPKVFQFESFRDNSGTGKESHISAAHSPGFRRKYASTGGIDDENGALIKDRSL